MDDVTDWSDLYKSPACSKVVLEAIENSSDDARDEIARETRKLLD